jgi:hypothetical protein
VHVNRAEAVNGDLRFELRKRVHPFLFCPPVEFYFPMFYETLDVRPVVPLLVEDCRWMLEQGPAYKGAP